MLELIRKRWSPRSFSEREVSQEDLVTLLEAARWAASSSNEQPWRFLVAPKSNPEAFQKILHLLVPGNQAWAKTAAVLMIMAVKKTFGDGSPNPYAMHDAGQAFANMALQAVALGMYIHGMAGFDRERARKELSIPDDFELGAAVAIGYLGSPEQLSDSHKTRELAKRERKPLSELVFGAGWNQAPPLP